MKFYSSNENINNLIGSAMEKIKTIVDSSTVIGEKVETSEPTKDSESQSSSKGGCSGAFGSADMMVGLLLVVGGGEYADLSSRRVANHFPMAGGSSGGMSLSPVGFLIIKEGEVKFINVENKTLYQTILNTFNTLLAKLNEKNEESQEENNEK